MIMFGGFFLALLTVPLAGGKLSWITRIRMKGVGWVIAALLVQVLIMNIAAAYISIDVAEILHKISYGLVGVFLWSNRKISGLWMVVLGGALNLVAITANGGVMPATNWALETGGKAQNDGETFTNSGRTEDAKVIFLGDVFAWPKPLPLHNVFSVGDVILVIGGGVVLHRACGSRLSKGKGLPPESEDTYMWRILAPYDRMSTRQSAKAAKAAQLAEAAQVADAAQLEEVMRVVDGIVEQAATLPPPVPRPTEESSPGA
jgi:hypothetical protein